MKNTLFVFLLLFVSKMLAAQTLTGTWRTVDDNTNEASSHVQIYESGGKFFGKVVKLLQDPDNEICEKCPGDRKNQLVLGMVILENMEMKEGYLQKGKILDPENGKTYTCKMWLKAGEPNVLVVRGYLFGFYRTQYWYRI